MSPVEHVGLPVEASDQVDALVRVIDLVRRGEAHTRPELGRVSGLGRSIVTQRVEQSIELGLIADAAQGPSTGGRAPRLLRFCADRGVFLAVIFGAQHVGLAVTDLDGAILESHHSGWDIAHGPDASLAHVAQLLDELRSRTTAAELWGITVGVPGPVEFRTGRPIAPPIMPGWDGFDIRSWFEQRYNAPVWVDNDVNLMALGELTRCTSGTDTDLDMLFIKVGTGVGAGLISGGRLHRGANGGAGDVGHIIVTDPPAVVCRCGKMGCLEAIAGGWALARDGEAAATSGRSPYLARCIENHRAVRPADIADGARNGDPACVELVAMSGRLIGENVASMVNFFNPSLVAIGGSIAAAGDLFLASVRQTVYQRSLPLATRSLRIVPAADDHGEGLAGAATLASQQIFDRLAMRRWVAAGAPSGVARSELYSPPAAA